MIPIIALRMILDRDSSERKARLFKNITEDSAKQIGTGMLLYTHDNDDRLPSVDGWEENLYPYTRNRELIRGATESLDKQPTRFAMNRNFSLGNVAELSDPSKTPIFFLCTLSGPSASGDQNDVALVHGQEGVFTFADGVGRSLGEERVESLNWNMK